MKLTIIPLVFLCTSCFYSNIFTDKGRFTDRKDDFLGENFKAYERMIRSEERPSPIGYINFYAVNAKEQRIYITMYIGADTFFPEKTLYAKLDNEIYKWPLENLESGRFRTATSSTSSSTTDSTTHTIESAGFTENLNIKALISLDAEKIEKIKKAQNISFRLYSGSKSNTFQIKELEQLKNVFR